MTAFEFSKKITQYNCRTCGAFVIQSSKLADDEDADPKVHWDVMTGTLAEVDGAIELRGHIYLQDTKDGGFADWLTTWRGKDLRRWSLYDDRDVMTPAGWRDESSRPIHVKPGDKLHAYCKCGGVQFWIRRAAKSSNNGEPRPQPSMSGEMCSPALAAWLRADSGKYLACNCSCNSCRLATGKEVTQWAYVRTEDIFQDEAGLIPFAVKFGSLKTYQSSPNVTRSFCSVCGAATFFSAAEREGVVDVAVGLLASPDGARAESWLEWRLERLGFRGDTVGRSESIALAIEHGFDQFQKRSTQH
ncbi:hypothetical protein AMS68_000720 [Peltaster fructicola]|uniref:CENP-V/GFA domain-containing protein n=1 Tax=Peltaster fructicola TaxID=286661 RepID=A0A6H0XKF2_9PEZI|nr:hypothetical protein AMS68_000720 [Peltaster fructicola]